MSAGRQRDRRPPATTTAPPVVAVASNWYKGDRSRAFAHFLVTFPLACERQMPSSAAFKNSAAAVQGQAIGLQLSRRRGFSIARPPSPVSADHFLPTTPSRQLKRISSRKGERKHELISRRPKNFLRPHNFEVEPPRRFSALPSENSGASSCKPLSLH